MSVPGDVIGRMVREVCDLNKKVVDIDPDFVGDRVMEDIARHDRGLTQREHILAWFGCLQHVKQVARGHLRYSFHPDRDDRQGDMGFPRELQERYPTRPDSDGNSQYRLRQFMTEEDLWWNYDRLLMQADARIKHAEKLAEEIVGRFGPRKSRRREAAPDLHRSDPVG